MTTAEEENCKHSNNQTVEQPEENLEKLQALCQELFRTNYEDESPFGKSVIRRALREREAKQKDKNEDQEEKDRMSRDYQTGRGYFN